MRSNRKWIGAFFFCEVVMVLLLVANQIPWDEVAYAAAVSTAVIVLVFVWDGIHQWRRLQKLREQEQAITLHGKQAVAPENAIEEEYQKLLELSAQGREQQENESLEKQKNMREYYAMWVHQIKTPISALRLLLQEKDELGSSSEELGELFLIEQYVEMALQYVRLESESSDFVIEQVKLDEVIRSAIRKYARMFIRKKISLDYEETDLTVLTDKKWLSFVTEQILSNAVKYTAKGEIKVSVRKEGETELFLTISDTGIGIKAEDLPRICENGYTGYNGHANGQSTGIGLYLCSRMLKKLGHSLTITSKEGEGTTVCIGFQME